MDNRKPLWHGLAISMVGSGHKQRGLPCQDSSILIAPNSRTVVLVVADGAGSQANSELGSRTATATVASLLNERLSSSQPSGETEWQALFHECFAAARQSLENLVDANLTLRSLSTTLLILGIDGIGAASASIGDCAAIVGRHPYELQLIAAPDSGEYVNETSFLTQSSWRSDIRFNFLRGRWAFGVAFSDSLQYVALHHGKPFPGFVTKLVMQLRGLDADKREVAIGKYFSDFVAGKRTDDDISFLAAWHTRRKL